METESGRVRAWVLVRSKNPEETSEALAADYYDAERELPFGAGGDDIVVVRADLIDGEMNLMVPVDVANEDFLHEVVKRIREKGGVTETSVFRVLRHNPDPPHSASTYVTPEEFGRDRAPEFDPPGRHPRSPGKNAWG